MIVFMLGCSKDQSGTTAPSASAPAASSAPVASAAPSASAEPPPRSDCPTGSAGPGTFTKPCETTAATDRTMTVKFKKYDDKGVPQFTVINTSKSTILWGKVAIYSYDKAGKQMDVKDEAGKAHPFHTCSGNIFGGTMEPKDNYVIGFSCVTKKDIPDGAVTIEAEMAMVGFADSTKKQIDFYWRNKTLTPDVRPKGGPPKPNQ